MMFNERFARRSHHLYTSNDADHAKDCSMVPVSLEDDYMNEYAEDMEILSSPSPPERRTPITYQTQYAQDYEIDECDEYFHETAVHHQPQSSRRASPPDIPNYSSPNVHSGSYDRDKIVSPDYGEAYNTLDTLGYQVPTTDVNDSRQDTEPGISRGFNSRNAHGIRLRPVSCLPDMYRGLFKFGVFNAVQSSCMDDVISAPTGSGKTVIFELAIIKMLREPANTDGSLKCVYMAPTKALCSERYKDWTAKFGPLGIKCE
ncbi:hypothetical protein D9615_004090 [Tricholomella constricta]|uniref:Helicase ATP-binding domain-containing protein n=1 Tax=Tricholomella constricta TaxID=117010 RepID=A0A8H5M558_9AGAR|nr:hypothetical protein D9615_004090 [Tricholomella constricta]